MPAVREVLGSGDTKTSVLTSTGLQVDLRIVEPRQFGAACQYFTGLQGAQHQAPPARPRAGMAPERVRPQRRRDRRGHRLRDRGGDLPGPGPRSRSRRRCAKTGGRSSRPPRASCRRPSASRTFAATCTCTRRSRETARARSRRSCSSRRRAGLRLPGDHRPRGEPRVQRGEPGAARRATRGRSRRSAPRYPGMTLLQGAELNIGRDGGVDYDEAFRAQPRLVRRRRPLPLRARTATQQTRRILAAMEDPTVHAIAHLTGRRIGRRAGIELDIDAVLRKAVETGTAIEINAALGRLDASSEVLLRARGLERDLRRQHGLPPHARARAHGVGASSTRPAAGSTPPASPTPGPARSSSSGCAARGHDGAGRGGLGPRLPPVAGRLLREAGPAPRGPEADHDLGAEAARAGGRAHRRGLQLREQPLLSGQARLRAGLRAASARRWPASTSSRPATASGRRSRRFAWTTCVDTPAFPSTPTRSATGSRCFATSGRSPRPAAERGGRAPGQHRLRQVRGPADLGPRRPASSSPSDFVGRGDMSRGGLMLRCVAEGRGAPLRPARRAPRATALGLPRLASASLGGHADRHLERQLADGAPREGPLVARARPARRALDAGDEAHGRGRRRCWRFARPATSWPTTARADGTAWPSPAASGIAERRHATSASPCVRRGPTTRATTSPWPRRA